MMAREREGLPIAAMAAVPRIAMQLSIEFLRFQNRRKRGVRSFRRTLIRSGLTREQATRLAQAYHEVGSFRKILQSAVRPSA